MLTHIHTRTFEISAACTATSSSNITSSGFESANVSKSAASVPTQSNKTQQLKREEKGGGGEGGEREGEGGGFSLLMRE